jgi:AAA family ATP:ADP antiporter
MRAPKALRVVAALRPGEGRFAAAMSLAFFLVITTFWILKPVKKALFVQFYDASGFELGPWHLAAAQTELIAKVANAAAAAAAMALFALLARHLRRQRLCLGLLGLFALGELVYLWRLAAPSAADVWSLYVFGDLFSTLMVASFFAFLADSTDADGARRLYGPIGLGGVLGGVVGTTGLSLWIDRLPYAGWMGVCVGLGALLALTLAWAGRVRPPLRSRPEPPPPRSGSAALLGARLVVRSRYLGGIVALVALYELVSTIMDFQFTSAVAQFKDGDAIGAHFSTVYAITNGVSLLVQLFVTTPVLNGLGVTAALLVMPLAAGAASGAFLIEPHLWTGSALNTADNGFAYSIQQSAKEALYVPTSRTEKYQAKAFIDVFAQRFAKALAVLLSLGLTLSFASSESRRWLSVVTLAGLVLWCLIARDAGRRFRAWEQGDADGAFGAAPAADVAAAARRPAG